MGDPYASFTAPGLGDTSLEGKPMTERKEPERQQLGSRDSLAAQMTSMGPAPSMAPAAPVSQPHNNHSDHMPVIRGPSELPPGVKPATPKRAPTRPAAPLGAGLVMAVGMGVSAYVWLVVGSIPLAGLGVALSLFCALFAWVMLRG